MPTAATLVSDGAHDPGFVPEALLEPALSIVVFASQKQRTAITVSRSHVTCDDVGDALFVSVSVATH
jgi:hypothetical protein